MRAAAPGRWCGVNGLNDVFMRALARVVAACVACYTLALIVVQFWLPLLLVVLLVAGGRYLWWRSGR